MFEKVLPIVINAVGFSILYGFLRKKVNVWLKPQNSENGRSNYYVVRPHVSLFWVGLFGFLMFFGMLMMIFLIKKNIIKVILIYLIFIGWFAILSVFCMLSCIPGMFDITVSGDEFLVSRFIVWKRKFNINEITDYRRFDYLGMFKVYTGPDKKYAFCFLYNDYNYKKIMEKILYKVLENPDSEQVHKIIRSIETATKRR